MVAELGDKAQQESLGSCSNGASCRRCQQTSASDIGGIRVLWVTALQVCAAGLLGSPLDSSVRGRVAWNPEGDATAYKTAGTRAGACRRRYRPSPARCLPPA